MSMVITREGITRAEGKRSYWLLQARESLEKMELCLSLSEKDFERVREYISLAESWDKWAKHAEKFLCIPKNG